MTDVPLFDDGQWVKAPAPKAGYRCSIKVFWWEDDGFAVSFQHETLDDIAGRWYRTSMGGKSGIDTFTAKELCASYVDELIRKTPPF